MSARLCGWLACLLAAGTLAGCGRGRAEVPPVREKARAAGAGANAAGGASVRRPEAAAPETGEERIAALVRQLGDTSWDQREAAQRRLIEAGLPAVPRLRAALAQGDLEVSSRARAILVEIVGLGFLGVQVRDSEADDRAGRNLPPDGGAVVVEVLVNTPAAAAGLRPGDFLYALDGQKISDGAGLVEVVTRVEPGTRVGLTLYRNGVKQEQELVVARRPREEPER